MKVFVEKYGPWALVAGASEGLGAEFARQLAARGLSVVLVARRVEVLRELATEIEQKYNVQVRVAAIDLARTDLTSALDAVTNDIEIGMVVCNAARSTIGRFDEQTLESQLAIVDINCRATVAVTHLFTPPMVKRGRGGVIIMTSLAAGQGSPLLASYAASKAFGLSFAEALWHELRPHGVDVLGARAGATRTPNYDRAKPQGSPPPMQEPHEVAREALDAIANGPSVITGWKNKVAIRFLGMMPRKNAINLMGSTTARMYPHAKK